MSDYPQQTRRTPEVNNNNENHAAFVQNVAERVVQNVGQVIIGKRNEIRLVVLGLITPWTCSHRGYSRCRQNNACQSVIQGNWREL